MNEKRCVFIPQELFAWLEAEADIQRRTVDSLAIRVLEKHRARLANGVPVEERRVAHAV